MLLVPCPRAACTGPRIANVGGSTLKVNLVLAVTLPEVPVMVNVLIPIGVELLEMSVSNV